MNIALSSILIIIIFLPGLVFQKSYFSEPFSYRYNSNNILFDIAGAIIPTFLIHLLGFFFIHNFFSDYKINFYILEKLFSTLSFQEDNSPFENIESFFFEINLYFIGLIFLSFCLGHLLRKLVIYCNLDLKWKWLHFNNEWYYLFEKRYLSKEDKRNAQVYLDILVESNSIDTVYMGSLEDFTLAKGGGLESIRLAGVSKQEYKASSEEGIKNEVAGYTMVIPMRLIRNINIRYLGVRDEDEEISEDITQN